MLDILVPKVRAQVVRRYIYIYIYIYIMYISQYIYIHIYVYIYIYIYIYTYISLVTRWSATKSSSLISGTKMSNVRH
jgi:hypothetical protein